MIRPFLKVGASLAALGMFSVGAQAESHSSSNVPEPLYRGVLNMVIAQTFAENCQGLRFSRIAADRYINDIIKDLVRQHVREDAALRALRALTRDSNTQIETGFDSYMRDHNVSSLEVLCATGRSEMANNTEIGNMMGGR